MKKVLMLAALIVTVVLCSWLAEEALAAARGRLLFVPQDDGAAAGVEMEAACRALGYEVVMPPAELLSGGGGKPGQPDKLWAWMRANICGAEAAMVSADAMIYGGLDRSRKHELAEALLAQRAEQFEVLHEQHPETSFYVYSSLLRMPRSGKQAGRGEPAYYREYGADIFAAAALADKRELQGLTAAEQVALGRHIQAVPPDIWQDWQARRDKNLSVNRRLIDFTRRGIFRCVLIGKEEDAPLSQTNREGRILTAYAQGLPETQFQLLSGSDGLGGLLLGRVRHDVILRQDSITYFYGDNAFET
ncbi:Protein of unknown function [Selenomonas sp. GACV-9]|uniref:DUF4127 family protein n=1 Tax=Selenomonas sp. GACV-9 TaxID=3158782 RepID=UPI0008E5CD93|nr:Protein of unknown function [Selenomonas ruminantium]